MKRGLMEYVAVGFVGVSLLGVLLACNDGGQRVITTSNSRGRPVETMSDKHLSSATGMFMDTGSGLQRLQLGTDRRVQRGDVVTIVCKLSGSDLKRFPWYFHIEDPDGSVRNEPIMTAEEWKRASSYGGRFSSSHTITCRTSGRYHVAMTVGSTPFRRADIQVE